MNFSQNKKILAQEGAFENVICKMVAILLSNPAPSVMK